MIEQAAQKDGPDIHAQSHKFAIDQPVMARVMAQIVSWNIKLGLDVKSKMVQYGMSCFKARRQAGRFH